jgi:uncharacterized membrane protein YphA (DoxX/SURF4 family)
VSVLALVSRIVLALVFVVAAVQKLRSRRAVEASMAALVGARLAPIAAVAVPVAEVLLAVALLVFRESPVPALVAIVLLLGFTAVLVRALARHEPCACFGGGASHTPVQPGAIVRNGVLLALAVLATA